MEKPPPESEGEEEDEEEQMNNMLRDVIEAHRVVRDGRDDLEEIRRMINATHSNICTHKSTVDGLRVHLEDMKMRDSDFQDRMQRKDYSQALPNRNTASLKNLRAPGAIRGAAAKGRGPADEKQDETELLSRKQPSAIAGRGSNFGGAAQKMRNVRAGLAGNSYGQSVGEAEDRTRTKVEIVNTLTSINGTMKEFSEDLERRFSKAFNSKSGKKFGLSDEQMRRYGSKGTFSRIKDNVEDIEARARAFLKKHGSQKSVGGSTRRGDL